jgi:pimeloyl-ACP methyl ester carboxylesterase
VGTPEKIVLHSGPLRFSALSTGTGPLILCLHGFPDDLGSYRHQLPVFAEAGYRAVSVSMRGYEPSSQPTDGDYTMEAIARDVVGFAGELGAERAHLVGHDWGAAVAYTAAASAPERFASITAMAVPHAGRFLNEAVRYPRQLRLSWYMAFFQLRGVAEYFVERNDYHFIRRLWRDWSPGWDPPEDALRDVITTFAQPGVTRAALAYYRAALSLRGLTPSARASNRFAVPVPTLALTGARDGCIDTDVFQKMMVASDFPAGLEVRQIADAGHFPHQEQPLAVNDLILDWVARWSGHADTGAGHG